MWSHPRWLELQPHSAPPVPFRPDDGVHADGDDGDAYRRDSAADCGDSYCWSAPA